MQVILLTFWAVMLNLDLGANLGIAGGRYRSFYISYVLGAEANVGAISFNNFAVMSLIRDPCKHLEHI